MSSPATILSPYDKRVALVAEAITSNSTLDGDAAGELATRVLRALNSIPEESALSALLPDATSRLAGSLEAWL